MLQSIKNTVINQLVRLVNIVLAHPKTQANLANLDALKSDQQRQSFRSELRNLLQDEAFTDELWRATNIRSKNAASSWMALPNSIREARMNQATEQAADFVMREIPHLEGHATPFEVLKHCLSKTEVDGLYLEFGVYSGTTINFIASQTDSRVHGFDSFEGLPEQWGTLPSGHFHTKDNLPAVAKNVSLHKGWFDQTLPAFIESNPQPVAFLHADADLYSSTKTILWSLNPQIVSGTIIVFDEYFNYPYWREHEYKAFAEFCTEFKREFEYIAYADRGYSVAVRMK